LLFCSRSLERELAIDLAAVRLRRSSRSFSADERFSFASNAADVTPCCEKPVAPDDSHNEARAVCKRYLLRFGDFVRPACWKVQNNLTFARGRQMVAHFQNFILEIYQIIRGRLENVDTSEKHTSVRGKPDCRPALILR